MRTCGRCQNDLADSAFQVRKSGYYRGNCRVCENERRKSGRVYNNPTEIQAVDKRTYNRQRSLTRRSNPVHRPKIILEDSRKSDKKKGRQNDLDLDFITLSIKDGCSYCGNTELMMTLDRIDNSLGHIKLNVAPACSRCNLIRGDMPYQAWMTIVPGVKTAFHEGLFESWVPGPWSSK